MGVSARAAYLAEHPRHTAYDTGCPQHPCLALPGAPCTDGTLVLGHLHEGRSRLIDRKNEQRRRSAETAARIHLRKLGLIPPDPED